MNTSKILSLAFALVLGASAHAAETCSVCPQVQALFKRMEKTAADPQNMDTIEAQDAISDEANDIVKANLTDKNFTPGNAKILVKLIVKAIPYDNSLAFAQINNAAFVHLYNKPGSLLKSTIEGMHKSGEISTEDKRTMLQLFGGTKLKK